MVDIIGNNNYGNYTSGGKDTLGGVNDQFSKEMLELYKGSGLSEAEAVNALKDLTSLLAGLVDNKKGGGVGGKDMPPGAPGLEPPSEDFSVDQLSLIIGAMQTKITELQAQTAKEGIKVSEAQKQEAHQKAIAKIEEAAQKLSEANAKDPALTALKIVGLVCAAIAAIALTVATAGLASGALAVVAVAFACYAVADSVMSIASEISQAAGGPDISINAGLTKMFEAMALAGGMNEEEAKKFGQVAAMVTQLVIAVAGCAVGIANMATAATKLGSLSAEIMSKVIGKLANIVNTASTAVNGTTKIASGIINIEKAEDMKASEMAKAAKADIDKLIMLLTKAMEDDRERIKDLVEKLDQMMQDLSSLIAAGGESNTQMAKNIV